MGVVVAEAAAVVLVVVVVVVIAVVAIVKGTAIPLEEAKAPRISRNSTNEDG
jgi:hypothetical protein